MIKFICDTCQEEYPAKLSKMWGVEYEDAKETYRTQSDEPCHKCQDVIEEAKQEALAKRRKKV